MSFINALLRSALAVAVNSDRFNSLKPTASAAMSFAISEPSIFNDSLIPDGPLTAVT